MILSRYNIERLIAKGLVENRDVFDLRKLINPASLDVTLGCELMVPNGKSEPLKSWLEGNEEYFDWIKLEDGGTFTLQPQQFILAHTAEIFSIPLDICADFCLKSRLGRVGLEHQLAGFIDPGFNGSITLELYNSAPYPIVLKAGQRIGQLKFNPLDIPLLEADGYCGHYQGYNAVSAAVLSEDSTV